MMRFDQCGAVASDCNAPVCNPITEETTQCGSSPILGGAHIQIHADTNTHRYKYMQGRTRLSWGHNVHVGAFKVKHLQVLLSRG